jgi:hypothetical protein
MGPLSVMRGSRRRQLIGGVPAVIIAALMAAAILAAGSPVGFAAPAASRTSTVQFLALNPDGTPASSGIIVPGIIAGAGAALGTTAAATPSATPSQSAGPTLRPLGVANGAADPNPNRPIPVQPKGWLALKASGLVALVGGQVKVLPAGSNPMIDPVSGQPLPAALTLDTSWTQWIIEVQGVGDDEKGSYYHDDSYWKLCGDGAMTVALYYWQQRTGHPDVTGTQGYWLDPFVAQGAWWPRPGPRVAAKGKTWLGTYWSGSDTTNGFTANGRGFEMYLATTAQPPTWKSPGLAVFARSGKPVYPSTGTDRNNIQVGLNWEVSGHDPAQWATAYYATVLRTDPYLAHDLNAAVMMDVGRDGVAVVAAVDSYYLPNWQNRSKTAHSDHSIAIVGYDNTANPPTYSYIDTCGKACNQLWVNRKNGSVHVIPQSRLVQSMRYRVGSGFVW